MRRFAAPLLFLLALAIAGSATANPFVVDLAAHPDTKWGLLRGYGHTGDGHRGVPVAGGFDVDGDGHNDFAFSAMQADPSGRSGAGEAYLIFGDGTLKGSIDTAVTQADVLTFIGDDDNEACGSELWMDDVTGDGLGDLLIARQNHTPAAGRIGAGALTIAVGGAALRTYAATLAEVDLRTPPAALEIVTILGDEELDRLGIWMRTGDVTGDGIADIVVGADQVSELGETHRGAIYVIRGGAHLATSQTVDLADFATTALPGQIARITPPVGSSHDHFGATVQIADLDGNGTAEVLAGATLNRAGAAIVPAGASSSDVHASGGATDGTLFIAWDDNFTGTWPTGFEFEVTTGPGTHTSINGAGCNVSFAEEIVGGLDYDADGKSDLFVGDIVGNCGPSFRFNAGSGHVFYDSALLKGLTFDLSAPPAGTVLTHIYGAASGNIAGDTALHGDFDADGIADLAFSSPHATVLGRSDAGALHVFFGQSGGWPAEVDLASLPPSSALRITEIYGANGTSGSDTGDVLAYSAAAGDIDGDGAIDLITNEMVGNGVLPAAEDVGNLIILSGHIVDESFRVPSVGWLGATGLCTLLLAAGLRRRVSR